MIRYIVIAAINLLVVAAIAGNAAYALMRGCNMDGTCNGPSSPFTWALALGLGAASAGGTIALARYARRSRHVSRASIAFDGTRGGDAPVAAPDGADSEAMLARLARLSRGGEAVAPDAPPAAAGLATTATPDPQQPIPQTPELHLVVSRGERVPQRAVAPRAIGPAPATRIDWLLDRGTGKAARVRHETGFPWCVAGIDQAVQGLASFEDFLLDTDIPSECAAWRRIVAATPRGSALDAADARAFTSWFNASLRLVGRGGVVALDDAMHALEAEAACDGAIGRTLPIDFWQLETPAAPAARIA